MGDPPRLGGRRSECAARSPPHGSTEASISVAIEEVASAEWMRQVYEPEIAPAMERLYKKPGYGPF
jgi:hypothetical protein